MLWGHVAVQYLHVLLATLWFGGTMFLAFVVVPSLAAASPQAQGEIGGRIAQQTKELFAPVGGLTILLGIINATVYGPVTAGERCGTRPTVCRQASRCSWASC